MEERKFIRLKKEEYGIKEYIKRDLGKGKISKLDIEYTPIGEKIIISTSKPGFVIGRKGEKIEDLTSVLKTRFKLENPHVEIKEIEKPLFDAQTVADDLALDLERMGNLKFKVVAYKKLQDIMRAGALGCEIRTSGKLPSERAKSWRFGEGYLKKAGDSTKEVDKAKAVALTKTGVIGVKVAIMAPTARIYDRVNIDEALKSKFKFPSKETKEESRGKEIKEEEEKTEINKPKKIKKEKKLKSEEKEKE
ncbi:MAG: 30S ribosomal protein S3 [Candidatus Nanoarchaeia archaeon]|nr:30S ribosomal protein S3 [Candidatus Nanoarchaeia archaeon]